MKFKLLSFAVLIHLLAGTDLPVAEASGVAINEIMYHPMSESVLEEWIELYNTNAVPVDVTGWRFSRGVNLTFPAATIPAGGYLVVAANVARFQTLYPGVANVVGGWTGQLSNSRDTIELVDGTGASVDRVDYADEGDWAQRQRGLIDTGIRGWTWYKEHDGLGKSLELINSRFSNNTGQNWGASSVANGTPGAANSIASGNIRPMIRSVAHFPVVPSSSDAVRITAEIVDESVSGTTVSLHYRTDAGAFISVPMLDSGVSGDLSAGDGVFSALVPAQQNNTIVDFYVRAQDAEMQVRTWPAATLAAPDEGGAPTQPANALYQVDNSTYSGTDTRLKLILTQAERQTLAGIPCSFAQNSDAQMNATLVTLDPDGTRVHYLIGVRNRGHFSRCSNPPNYRLNFRSDDEWNNLIALNLNSTIVFIQHLGSVLARKAGADGAAVVPVFLHVNNQSMATAGAGGQSMFGRYAAVEAINGDWARDHHPLDSDGNVYKAVHDIPPGHLSYRGENPNSYRNTFFKGSNESEDDWTHLIGMLRAVGIDNTEPFTTENAERVVNVEQWLTHMAVMSLFGNNESGLNTGNNDDYYMYHGRIDTRFILIYWDLDQIMGWGRSLMPNASIFRATQPGDNRGHSYQVFDRLMHWPAFEPVYFRILQRLLNTTFSAEEFDALVDQTLEGYVDLATRDGIKNWMADRRTSVQSQLGAFTQPAPTAKVFGVPRSPTPLTGATLTVEGPGVTHYRVAVNGGGFGAQTPLATPAVLTGLGNGTNTIRVIGRNGDGIWQAEASATVRSWVVNTSWPAVRINEVLAQNIASYVHQATTPDVIELFNEGTSTVDLSNLRLTDAKNSPNKFIFPPGTSLAAGATLVVYADSEATSGFHTGFGLSQGGDDVHLFDRVSNGGALLDTVTFGMQLADRSIGRVRGGDWELNVPTVNAPNMAQALGDPRQLKINEWQSDGQSSVPYDYVELYNPEGLPVALGGLHLSDVPIGHPHRHQIAALSFIGAAGFQTFRADNDPGSGPDHLNFGLSREQGLIGLFDWDRTEIDCVHYGRLATDVSMGRCPDGGERRVVQAFRTPGAANACPFTPPPAGTLTLIPMASVWKVESSGTDLGTAWRGVGYDDSAWTNGPALLGNEGSPLPPPGLQTVIELQSPRQLTMYFRTLFNVANVQDISRLDVTHIIDDGAVFYINGVEVGTRFNMAPGPVTYDTTTTDFVAEATERSMIIDVATAGLVAGVNLFAVEVHQTTPESSDLVFGLRLDAVVATNSAVLAGVVLNEVLANNLDLAEPDGSLPDWVEVYNPSSNAVDLAGMGLSDSVTDRFRWVFPAGSIVPALGHFKVRLDPSLPSSNTNTGFGLKATGGTVYLSNRPQDGGYAGAPIEYGLQAANWSIGRVPDGSSTWVLTQPTFGANNLAVGLGNAANLKVNEWMPAPASGDDWFEIYNPNGQPVEVSGLHLTDRPDDLLKYQIPALSFIGIAEQGYQKFIAENGLDADHTGFNLNNTAEDIIISDATGNAIDGYRYTSVIEGVSEGRLPDGAGNIVRFTTTPTPGRSNFLPLDTLHINELLAHSDPPFEDAVEIFNSGAAAVALDGWFLSDSENNLKKYLIPNNTVVPPGGYVVFYEGQFNGDHPGQPFSFSSARGDEVYLSQPGGGGVITGYRASAEFGPTENGVSLGRFPTSQGWHFVAMTATTFGMDNPATTNEFQTGTGLPNATAKVGPIVISEIMYHPPGTNDNLEFIELRNITGANVPLYDLNNSANTWRLRQGVDFNFPPNRSIPAGGHLIVVPFNPSTDAAALADFQAAYGSSFTLTGPFSGKLDNAGEATALYKPDAPQPGGDVPYILVDRIDYLDRAPWPASADGSGDSLQRLSPSLYGNDPVNWTAATPTPGAGPSAVDDTDGDGIPDAYEDAHGLNKNFAGDALLDADGDGMTNLDEYRAGTDPQDPDSNLNLVIVSVSNGAADFRFNAVAGKTYTIQYRVIVDAGPWVRLLDVVGAASGPVVRSDTGAGTGQRFYRLVTPAAP